LPVARSGNRPLATGTSSGSGSAQERHFAPVIRGSDCQQSAQHDAVRALHGSCRSQTMHHDGRIVRNASRASSENTREF